MAEEEEEEEEEEDEEGEMNSLNSLGLSCPRVMRIIIVDVPIPEFLKASNLHTFPTFTYLCSHKEICS